MKKHALVRSLHCQLTANLKDASYLGKHITLQHDTGLHSVERGDMLFFFTPVLLPDPPLSLGCNFITDVLPDPLGELKFGNTTPHQALTV